MLGRLAESMISNNACTCGERKLGTMHKQNCPHFTAMCVGVAGQELGERLSPLAREQIRNILDRELGSAE